MAYIATLHYHEQIFTQNDTKQYHRHLRKQPKTKQKSKVVITHAIRLSPKTTTLSVALIITDTPFLSHQS